MLRLEVELLKLNSGETYLNVSGSDLPREGDVSGQTEVDSNVFPFVNPLSSDSSSFLPSLTGKEGALPPITSLMSISGLDLPNGKLELERFRFGALGWDDADADDNELPGRLERAKVANGASSSDDEFEAGEVGRACCFIETPGAAITVPGLVQTDESRMCRELRLCSGAGHQREKRKKLS